MQNITHVPAPGVVSLVPALSFCGQLHSGNYWKLWSTLKMSRIVVKIGKE